MTRVTATSVRRLSTDKCQVNGCSTVSPASRTRSRPAVVTSGASAEAPTLPRVRRRVLPAYRGDRLEMNGRGGRLPSEPRSPQLAAGGPAETPPRGGSAPPVPAECRRVPRCADSAPMPVLRRAVRKRPNRRSTTRSPRSSALAKALEQRLHRLLRRGPVQIRGLRRPVGEVRLHHGGWIVCGMRHAVGS